VWTSIKIQKYRKSIFFLLSSNILILTILIDYSNLFCYILNVILLHITPGFFHRNNLFLEFQETLRDYQTIIYVDSSIRFRSSDMKPIIDTLKNIGMLTQFIGKFKKFLDDKINLNPARFSVWILIRICLACIS